MAPWLMGLKTHKIQVLCIQKLYMKQISVHVVLRSHHLYSYRAVYVLQLNIIKYHQQKTHCQEIASMSI